MPRTLVAAAVVVSLSTLTAHARPTVEQALGLTPIQKDVDFDTPTAAEIDKCSLKAEKISDDTGWVVRDEDGKLLRRFIDTNDDNKVDRWCYFKDGIEVYRDVDKNFNGKADQYRWMGTAGVRWGLDPDENGVINSWKKISAEEASAEVVKAIQDKDKVRFERLLPDTAELAAMGLGEEQRRSIRGRIDKARDEFMTLARTQKVVNNSTNWLHFGATRPALIPAGTDGSEKDLTVYENVVAIIETDGKPGQLPLGTMVSVEGAWRVVDLPVASGDLASSGVGSLFLAASHTRGGAENPEDLQHRTEEWTRWIRQLEEVDKKLIASTSPRQQGELNAQRADVIERLIDSLPPQERETWIRQFADTVSAAVQSGQYPQGSQRLGEFYRGIARKTNDKDLHAYVKYRWISADYNRQLRAATEGPTAASPKAQEQVAKIQDTWLKTLGTYVREFPDSPDSAEAMLQLAIAEEFAGKDSVAERWYNRIVKDFKDDQRAKKAAGALRRLGCTGKSIPLTGMTTSGQRFDLAAYSKKTVVVHYWATWCEPCKKDMKALAALHAKYRSKGFEVVGVNLDTEKQAAAAYLRQQRINWPNLYEDGGLESRLASEMGILTLPTMFLLHEGKVVSRQLHIGQLEKDLEERLK